MKKIKLYALRELTRDLSSFCQTFNKTKKKIEDLESKNMFDEGDSPYLLLLSIEKRL